MEKEGHVLRAPRQRCAARGARRGPPWGSAERSERRRAERRGGDLLTVGVQRPEETLWTLIESIWRRTQAIARSSPVWSPAGLAWNCSSSVEPLSAQVAVAPPQMVCSTWSK